MLDLGRTKTVGQLHNISGQIDYIWGKILGSNKTWNSLLCEIIIFIVNYVKGHLPSVVSKNKVKKMRTFLVITDIIVHTFILWLDCRYKLYDVLMILLYLLNVVISWQCSQCTRYLNIHRPRPSHHWHQTQLPVFTLIVLFGHGGR